MLSNRLDHPLPQAINATHRPTVYMAWTDRGVNPERWPQTPKRQLPSPGIERLDSFWVVATMDQTTKLPVKNRGAFDLKGNFRSFGVSEFPTARRPRAPRARERREASSTRWRSTRRRSGPSRGAPSTRGCGERESAWLPCG